MDVTGRIITPQQFEDISSFSDGLAAVKIKGVWGFVDRSGKFIIPPTVFVKVGGFREGLAPACVRGDSLGERCGYIDVNGKLVIDPRFASAQSFESRWAIVTEPVLGNLLTINRKGIIV